MTQLTLEPLPPLSEIKQTSMLQNVLIMLGSAVVGGLLATIAVRVGAIGGGAGHTVGTKAAVILLSIAGAFFAILFHEAGHVAFGLARGFRFHFLTAGPLRIESSEGRLRVRLNKVMALWGGVAACSPPLQGDARKGMAWMAIGGPVASLLLALLALGAGTLTSAPAVRIPLNLTGVVSAGLFLVTAFLPYAGRGLRADGRRARDLLRGDAAAVAEASLLSLQGLSMAGVHPREWPPSLVRSAGTTDDNGTMTVGASLLVFQHALVTGDPAAAREALVRAINAAPASTELMIPAIASEAALFELIVRRDPSAAQPWLDRVSGPFVDSYRRELLLGLSAELRQDRKAEEHFASAKRLMTLATFGAAPHDRELLAAR